MEQVHLDLKNNKIYSIDKIVNKYIDKNDYPMNIYEYTKSRKRNAIKLRDESNPRHFKKPSKVNSIKVYCLNTIVQEVDGLKEDQIELEFEILINTKEKSK